MPTLTEVDYDPFAQGATLTEVEYDPFSPENKIISLEEQRKAFEAKQEPPLTEREQYIQDTEDEDFLFPEEAFTGDTAASGEAVGKFVKQFAALPVAGVLGVVGGLNQSLPGTFTEKAVETINRAMETMVGAPESEESAAILEKLNAPFEVLEDIAHAAGTSTQDLINEYAAGVLDAETATAVHTAIMMFPALLGFRGKGRKPAEEPTVPAERVVEGEVLPPTPERGRPAIDAKEKEVIEGEVVPEPTLKELSVDEAAQLRLEPPVKEKAPTQAELDARVYEGKTPEEISATRTEMEARRMEVEEILPEEITGLPVAKAEVIPFKFGRGPGGKEAGAVYPSEIVDGLKIIGKKIDDLGVESGWKEFAQPLQAAVPEAAAWAKNWANRDFIIADRAKQYKKEVSKIDRDVRATMHEAIENPSLMKDLSPEHQKMVVEMRDSMNELGDIAIHLGVLRGIKRPYAKHVVKMFMEDKNVATRLFGRAAFKTYIKSEHRKHETMKAGEKAGIEYHKDFNVMLAARMELERAVNNKMHVNALLESTGVARDSISRPGEDIKGYVSINHDAFNQRVYKTNNFIKYKGKKYKVSDGKVYVEGKEYPVAKGQVVINNNIRKVVEETEVRNLPIKVHPDWAPAIKGVLSEPGNVNMVTNALIKLKIGSMFMIMWNPAFHSFTVATKVFPVIYQKTFTLPVKGHKLMRDTAFREDAIAHNLRPLGGRGYQMDMYGEVRFDTKNIMHRIDPKLGAIFEKAGWFWHDFLLWDRIGDLQMGLYDHLTTKTLGKTVKEFKKNNRREPTTEELGKLTDNAKYAAAEASNLLVGAFGKEDFGKAWRDTLNLTLFSRSYTWSNARLGKYAVGIMPKHVLGQMQAVEGAGSAKAISAKNFTNIATFALLKDIFLAHATLYGLNYVLTAINDIPDKHGDIGGHFPDSNEPGFEHKIVMDVKDDGSIIYQGNPFRAARDITEIVTQPVELIKNKSNPIMMNLFRLMEGRDWKGKQIFKEESDWFDRAREGAGFLAKTYTNYEGFTDTVFPDATAKENWFRIIGLQISHGAKGGPEAGTIKSIQRAQAQEEDHIKQEALEHVKNNREAEAINMLKENKFTPEQISNFVMRSRDPKAHLLLNLDYVKLLRRATPEQRETLMKVFKNQGKKK